MLCYYKIIRKERLFVMKVTVIGCWGGYPAPDGATSAYLLEKDGFRLMVDMGSGALAKIQTYVHVMDIDAVILSHYHHDHIADIGDRKSTRLNSSHVSISYAVFCLKKKRSIFHKNHTHY